MIKKIIKKLKYRLGKKAFERELFHLNLFYKYSLYRKLVSLFYIQRNRKTPLNISHLNAYKGKEALGPVQREEALFLYGLIKTFRPKVILEIGTSRGHSAFNFLKACDSDSILYSVDCADRPRKAAQILKQKDPRFNFIFKSQADIEPDDYDHQTVDFLFIDCSHDFELNKQTFLNISDSLSDDAIIAVHDTGIWKRNHMFKKQKEYIDNRDNDRWLDDETCAHQPGERLFVNWIVENHPDYNSIHFHTTDVLRHGITLLQKERLLEVTED